MYKITYKSSVARDVKRLGKEEIRRILDGIESRLLADPRRGKALTGDFAGCYRYRFGNYRVIYSIIKDEVLILRIGHRREIYR